VKEEMDYMTIIGLAAAAGRDFAFSPITEGFKD
jgi:hypothetical protein